MRIWTTIVPNPNTAPGTQPQAADGIDGASTE